ncbi:MAG: cyclic nucleotide-binding domain-containing protein [Thermodesulfobacteriota bacterium]
MSFGDYTKQFHIAEMEDYKKDDVIFKEGASGDWIYVIMQGEVEIYKMVKGKKIVVDVLKEGDLFGEVSFIDKKPRSAGARALSEVTVGIFDKEYLSDQYNRLPNNFRVIFDAMARRLRKMTAVATNLASRGMK